MDRAGRFRKLSKEDRRIGKKQAKLKETLFRHEQLTCCEEPSRHIVVANGGLGNGVDREKLWCLFEKFGQMVDVVMKPRKPYAFVSFQTVDAAVKAVKEVNGRHLEDSNEDCPLLYLLYLKDYDNSDLLSNYAENENLPAGLVILENFISCDEEQELLSSICWDRSQSESLKHRRVAHYGYKFMYNCSNIDRNPLEEKIPASCIRIMSRLLEQGLIPNLPDQLTVNQYEPGQGIPPHVDTHSAFEDVIIIINLQSQITMEFKKCEADRDHQMSVVFPRLSAVILSGEMRYNWTHGITPRVMDIVPVNSDDPTLPRRLTLHKRETRTSLTLRTVRKSAICQCSTSFSVCKGADRDVVKLKVPCRYSTTLQEEYLSTEVRRTLKQILNKKVEESLSFETEITNDVGNLSVKDELSACQLESDYVHKVYETIANHFSDTRHTPWPRVASFINQFPEGAIVADVGCGNGKYLGVNRNIFAVGCDRSSSLCDICSTRGYESFVCDGLNIPIRNGVCDAALCIAVIHHMSTTLRRQKAVKELVRILRVGGQVLIYVWALEQERGNVKSKYLKPSKTCATNKSEQKTAKINADVLPASLPVHVNRTAFEKQDIFVPWHLKQSTSSAQRKRLTTPVDGGTSGSTSGLSGSESNVLHRYYHTFVEGELERMCGTIENVGIVDSYYDQGNWCIVLQKNS